MKRAWNLAATLLLCSPALGEWGATVVTATVITAAWYAAYRGLNHALDTWGVPAWRRP